MSLKTITVPRWTVSTLNPYGVLDGEYTVTAEAAGPFNVFRSPGMSEHGWTLSHAPTGRALRTDLPSRASARRLAEELSQFNWDFTLDKSPYAHPGKTTWKSFPRGYRRDMRKAAKIVREWER